MILLKKQQEAKAEQQRQEEAKRKMLEQGAKINEMQVGEKIQYDIWTVWRVPGGWIYDSYGNRAFFVAKN